MTFRRLSKPDLSALLNGAENLLSVSNNKAVFGNNTRTASSSDILYDTYQRLHIGRGLEFFTDTGDTNMFAMRSGRSYFGYPLSALPSNVNYRTYTSGMANLKDLQNNIITGFDHAGGGIEKVLYGQNQIVSGNYNVIMSVYSQIIGDLNSGVGCGVFSGCTGTNTYNTGLGVNAASSLNNCNNISAVGSNTAFSLNNCSFYNAQGSEMYSSNIFGTNNVGRGNDSARFLTGAIYNIVDGWNSLRNVDNLQKSGIEHNIIMGRGNLFGFGDNIKHVISLGNGNLGGGVNNVSNVISLGQNAGTGLTQSNRFVIGWNELPRFANAAAALALPAASANGVYVYWNQSNNAIEVRP